MKNDPRLSRPRFAMFAVAAIAVIAAACADTSAPSAPREAADRSLDPGVAAAMHRATLLSALIPDSYITQGLLREHALPAAVTASKSISSRQGGTIDVPGTDFQLVIPKGAFDAATMTISVTALPGSAVAYNFEPHGTHFNVPLKFVQKLGHTNLKNVKLPPGFTGSLSGAYFADPAMIDPVTGISVVGELISADMAATWSGDQVTFPIWHFSGYMVATGRASDF